MSYCFDLGNADEDEVLKAFGSESQSLAIQVSALALP
jgi:hypothetical protein